MIPVLSAPRPVGTAVSVVSVTVSVASLPIRVDCLDYYCIVALLQDRTAHASSQGTTHLCTKRHFTNNNYTRSASLRDVTRMVLLGPEGCSLLYHGEPREIEVQCREIEVQCREIECLYNCEFVFCRIV